MVAREPEREGGSPGETTSMQPQWSGNRRSAFQPILGTAFGLFWEQQCTQPGAFLPSVPPELIPQALNLLCPEYICISDASMNEKCMQR